MSHAGSRAAPRAARRSVDDLRPALVDVAVVVLSLGMVLSLLDESYWTRDYLVAGLAPVVLLLALALVLRGMTEGVWWYWLAALAAYAPFGALVALRRPGPWIVPTFDTMTRVLGETVQAPRLFVSTMPPVEASGTLLLLPYAIGFLAGAPAAWLALGTRRPVAPAAAVVVGLAATIPVAVLVPDHLILRGIVLATVLVTWAAARARRAESLATGARGRLAATATSAVVVLLVSMTGSLLVPDNDQTDRVLLAPDGDGAAAASRAADTIVPPQTGRGPLLKVSGLPEGLRIRFGALDLYDGEAWVPAGQSPGAGAPGSFRRLGTEITPQHDGPRAEVRVRVRPGYASDWLPLVGDLAAIDVDYTDGRTQLKDIRYNQATGSALVVGGVDPRDDYTFTSVLTPVSFRRSEETQDPDEAQRQPEGAFLDQYLVPFDRSDLAPLQRVLLLARYLRQNGAVRLTGPSSQEPVDLGLRLLGSKRMTATPFQYSAVMALGASRLGVPARVVVGAAPGRGGVVEQDDVTSWVELQFADGTWRTLEPDRYVGVHPAEEEVDEESVSAGGWVRAELDRDADIKIPKGADIELGDDAVFEEQVHPWPVLGTTLAALAGALVLAWLAVPFAKALRRRRRRSGGGWSGTYVNGWQEVLDTARDRGTPVPDTWSRVAQARALGVGLDLAREADAAVFAPSATPDEDRASYWRRTQEVRRSLLTDLTWQRRAWALLNPASLVAGWRRRRSADGSGAGPVRHEDRRPRGEQPAGA